MTKLTKMTKLFVYGVNQNCPKDILEDEFSKCGRVDDVYITRKGKNQVMYDQLATILILYLLS